jgi:hypothetical protein
VASAARAGHRASLPRWSGPVETATAGQVTRAAVGRAASSAGAAGLELAGAMLVGDDICGFSWSLR